MCTAPTGLLAEPAMPSTTIYKTERRMLGSLFASDSLPRILDVALPPSYADSTAERYPVIYVLDGDGLFALTAGIERGLLLGRETPEAIIVGLAWGRDFPQTSSLRLRNFTPTAIAGTPSSGHAPELLAYLKNDVVPLVDSAYRTLPHDRTLVGQSRGGLFALYAMYENPDLFQRLIVGSPQVNACERYVFRADSVFALSHRPLKEVLYVSVGSAELTHPGGAAIREFIYDLRARHHEGLRLIDETLPGETHNSSFPVAVTHGLKAVFAQ